MNRGRLLHILTLVDKLNEYGEQQCRTKAKYTTAIMTYGRESVQVTVFSNGGGGNDVTFVSPFREGAVIGPCVRNDEGFVQCEEYIKRILEVVV